MRDAMLEKDKQSSMKRKARERIRPTLSRLDIDYDVLHDAFFKYQIVPDMSSHGQVYHLGHDTLIKSEGFTVNQLSKRLQDALGMSPGDPPPYLKII